MSASGVELVACARGWLGTKFVHQGRLKKTSSHKGGVDCLGLLVGVAGELGLKDRHGRLFAAGDNVKYSHMPDVCKLRECLNEMMYEIPLNEMCAGDVLLMNVDGRPQHLGIVSDKHGVIHAYAPARAVVEHALDAWWTDKIVAVFRPEL